MLGERFGIRRLLLEGGCGINGSMLATGLVDELHVLIAPAPDGGKNVEGIVSHGADGLTGAVTLLFQSAIPLDHGFVYSGWPSTTSSLDVVERVFRARRIDVSRVPPSA